MGKYIKNSKVLQNIKCCQHYYSINGLVWFIELNVINLWFYNTYMDL